MTTEDLEQIDQMFTLNSRFLAAVIREHGIRVKTEIELLAVNVLAIVGCSVAAAVVVFERSFLWEVVILFCAAPVLWQHWTTKVKERAEEAIRGLWHDYSGIHGNPLIPPEEFMQMTPEQLQRVAGAPEASQSTDTTVQKG